MWYIALIIIWIVVMPFAYHNYIKDFNNNMFEKIVFTIMWPFLVPMWIIHYFHNKE